MLRVRQIKVAVENDNEENLIIAICKKIIDIGEIERKGGCVCRRTDKLL